MSTRGICVTRSVRDHVHGRLDLAFEGLGTLNLKNISRPIEAFLLKPNLAAAGGNHQQGSRYDQEIQFSMTRDGVQLAYSRMGCGALLVKTGNWMTHLEFDFESPIWRHLSRAVARSLADPL